MRVWTRFEEVNRVSSDQIRGIFHSRTKGIYWCINYVI